MSQQKPIRKRREQTRTNDPMQIRLSGPRISVREPDSVHIASFSQLGFEHGSYYNSVPLNTAELERTREVITEWLGDGEALLERLAEQYGYRLVSEV